MDQGLIDYKLLNEAERYVQFGFGEGWRVRAYAAPDLINAFWSGKNAAIKGVPWRWFFPALFVAGFIGGFVGGWL